MRFPFLRLAKLAGRPRSFLDDPDECFIEVGAEVVEYEPGEVPPTRIAALPQLSNPELGGGVRVQTVACGPALSCPGL